MTTAESIDNLVKKIEGDISTSQKDVRSAVLQAKEVSSLKEKIDNLKEVSSSSSESMDLGKQRHFPFLPPYDRGAIHEDNPDPQLRL